MSCPSPTTPECRLISFNVRYSLNQLMSGSLTFSDTTCLDDPDCSDINRPVTATVETTLDSSGNLAAINTCYSETPVWLNGLMRSYSRSNADGTTTVDVSSFFEYLNSKPILTQQFKGYWLSEVLDTIFRYYAGVPMALYSTIDFKETRVLGPVQGNIFTELQTLAQAGQASIYTQVGGKLEMGLWKDDASPIEFDIPEEAVISAEPAQYRYPTTTMINLKGASISKFDCGEKDLKNDENDNPGKGKKCIISGLKVKNIKIDLNSLTGDEENLKSAEILFNNNYTVTGKKEIKNKIISTKARKSVGFFGPITSELTYRVKGKNRSATDETYNENYRANKFWENPKGAYDVFMRLAAREFPVPYSSFGLGAFGSPRFISSNSSEGKNQNNPVETQLQQLETIIIDPDLNANGVSVESLENKYVYTKPKLFKLGVRRFQEIKMAQNTWNVETIYLPCIKLNQVVQFKVPETEGCTQKTIKGIVSGIDLDHSTDTSSGVSCTSMRLAIMDTACLNTTDYVSGNLLDVSCAGANSGDLNPWQTSAYNLETTASLSSCGAIFATQGATAYLKNVLYDINPGESFSIGFEYQQLQGTSPMTFSLTGAAGPWPTILLGTGTFFQTFTSGNYELIPVWQLLGPINPTYFKICNIQIIQTFTA